MSRSPTRSAAASGLLIAFAASIAALSGPAKAQPFEREPYEERRFETKRPQRGYEGFPAPGVYCSYRREPNRVCTYDKKGRKKCHIKSWTLFQSCG
jgi:hypothetical protein